MADPLSIEELKEMFYSVGDLYENLHLVSEDNGDVYHVHPDGTPPYTERYQCGGHFENGSAWVMKFDGGELYIRPDGSRVEEPV